jgi:WD40 repeat protein
MSDEQQKEAERRTHSEAADEEPQLFALTRQAGGYRLDRRGFLGATGFAALASGGVRGAEPDRTAGRRTARVLLKDAKEAARFRAHRGAVNSIAFSPDGRLLASGSQDRTVRLWSLREGQLVGTLKGHSDNVNSVAVSPDGSLLASGSADKTVRLWSLSRGEPAGELRGHSESVSTVAFSPIGRRLASGSLDQTIRLWSVSKGDEAGQWLCGCPIWSLAFSPDGKLLASGGYDGAVRLWSAPGRESARTLKGHAQGVTSVAFSPNGSLLASGSPDQTIRLWSVSKGDEASQWLCGCPVWSLASSPDGKLLASGSSSPGGKLLASGGFDDTIRLWTVPTGECNDTLEGHSGQIKSVAFSPNGKLLASADADGVILLWELGGQKRRWALFDPACIEELVNVQSYREQARLSSAAVCSCDLICTCDTVWAPAGTAVAAGTVCMCHAITVGTTPAVAQGGRTTARQLAGDACVCDQICTCDGISTSSTGGGGRVTTYWYPN